MLRDRTITAGAEDAGKRLDRFLVERLATITRALATEAIEAGRVRVNERPARKGDRLAAGDRVTVAELMESKDWTATPNPAVAVHGLHAEPAFLAVDKPAGQPVHPLHPRETDTLVNGLLAAYPELAGVGPDPLFPAVVHRLDAETSGVMLVARTAEAYEYFRRAFRERKMEKRYVALVGGRVASPGRLEHALAHSTREAHRMVVADPTRAARGQRPLRAVTEYAVREPYPRHTLLDVVIRTGVTHQIRCQLAAAGHPVAGDALYGSAAADAGYRGRLFLHAAAIAFRHPATGAACEVRAPLPPDLQAALAALREKPEGG